MASGPGGRTPTILALLILGLALTPTGSAAAETFAVVAVGDPPGGPDGDLAELTHQLRSACRDRVGNVLDVPSMQARLRGQSEGATLSELDRAYGGALAVYQNGEFESALRTLQAIVQDIEALPEGREPYQQWIRASLRLAHAAATIGRHDVADAAITKLLRIEPNLRADPDQYSPTYRRRMDELRARVRSMPQRRVTVVANGRAGHLFVDGRPSGTTPMTLFLPAGRYRIGGATGLLRVPSFQVDVTEEDRTVVLDFETAEAIRMTAGPGLVLPMARRAEGLIRAGAWLDVDKLIVASRAVEGDAPFLVGGIYDVRRGALLREGSVRTVAGSVPSANIGALAAFLLTGAQQKEVRARPPEALVATPRDEARDEVAPRAGAVAVPSPPPATAPPPAAPSPTASSPTASSPTASSPTVAPRTPPPTLGAQAVSDPPTPPAVVAPPSSRPALDLRPRAPAEPDGAPGVTGRFAAAGAGAPGHRRWLEPRPWMRPAAWACGGLALGFAGIAVERRLAAADAYDEADGLLVSGNVLASAADLPRYRSLTADGDDANRAAWVSAGVSVAFAAVAAVFGWTSADLPRPDGGI